MASLDSQLRCELDERLAAQRFRQRQILQGAQDAVVQVGDLTLVNFSSNDYLGLANHPELIAAMQRAAQDSGVGSGASHLICGHSEQHHALEEELAAMVGRPRAVLFSTGYMANLGVMDALLRRGDWVFQDRLNHASLLDAGRLSAGQQKRFQSGDLQSLRQQLESAGCDKADENQRRLIVTDGVFSMDGKVADLPGLAQLAAEYQAWLMVDDAHGLGVLGATGGGCAEHFDLNVDQLPILMGTLGKGLGSFGAFVAGSEALVEYLIQYARTYIYTTALPPAVAAATRVAVRLAQEESWRREHLQQLVRRFRKGAEALGLEILSSNTPIQPVILGDDARVLAVGQALKASGFLVGAIRPPTVPEGQGRLRITITAAHDESQVDQLLSALADSLNLVPPQTEIRRQAL